MYRPLKYVGGWSNGKRSGHGLLERMDGSTLEGLFVDGFIDGSVTITYADGRKDTALYERGSRVGWTDTQKHTSTTNWADTGIDRDLYREVGRSASPWTLTGRMREADLSWLPLAVKQRRLQFERRRLKSRLKLLGRSLGQVKTAELNLDEVEKARGLVDAREQERRKSIEERDTEYDKRAWASMYNPGE